MLMLTSSRQRFGDKLRAPKATGSFVGLLGGCLRKSEPWQFLEKLLTVRCCNLLESINRSGEQSRFE